MGRRPKSVRLSPSEDEIAAAVIAHWRALAKPGTLVASIPNRHAFGQTGLTPGLPDLMVISPALGEKTGFIELKRSGGRRSKAQIGVAVLMEERAIPYALTFGRDEPIKILEVWGAVRASSCVHGVERTGEAGPRAMPAGD